jgi:hypothetical protein
VYTCASGSGVTKHDSKKNKPSLKRSSQHAPPVSGFYAWLSEWVLSGTVEKARDKHTPRQVAARLASCGTKGFRNFLRLRRLKQIVHDFQTQNPKGINRKYFRIRFIADFLWVLGPSRAEGSYESLVLHFFYRLKCTHVLCLATTGVEQGMLFAHRIDT